MNRKERNYSNPDMDVCDTEAMNCLSGSRTTAARAQDVREHGGGELYKLIDMLDAATNIQRDMLNGLENRISPVLSPPETKASTDKTPPLTCQTIMGGAIIDVLNHANSNNEYLRSILNRIYL